MSQDVWLYTGLRFRIVGMLVLLDTTSGMDAKLLQSMLCMIRAVMISFVLSWDILDLKLGSFVG